MLVGNPRKLRVIWSSNEKCDDRDAEMLARIARVDPKLLYPITHRARESQYEKRIKKLGEEKYPETAALRAVVGVGPITALAYVLTLEDPKRFKKSQDVGPFLGLVPRRDQSGDTDKQLSITKAGSFALRRLLVGCSQYILGAFGPECELR